MSSFNVEKEAERLLKDHIIDQEVGSPTALHYNLCSLLNRCRDATEGADIKAVCCLCELGIPVAEIGGEWMHPDPDDETDRTWMICDATPIHERRQREEQG